ncbi:MAG: ATP-binding protein [Deltaproteobacteria bacterium]|nr:ATP-binding protein [Deltaproteobacteria bacterium]
MHTTEEILHSLNPSWLGPARYAERWPTRRALQRELLEKLSRSDRRALVIRGPRQVGKTTILLQLMDDLAAAGIPARNLAYFDFSDPRLPADGLSPRDIVELAPKDADRGQPRFFFLDEIDTAHRWDEWLKHAVDQYEHRVRFVVTDSSSALLSEAGRQSGLGRWDERTLEALTFREFLALQALPGEPIEATHRRVPAPYARFLSIGGRPEHSFNPSALEVQRRVREDIADRAITRDLSRFRLDVGRVRELFVYLLEDSGAILNAPARLRLMQRADEKPIDKRTLQDWIGRLEQTMLIARLEPFAKAATAKLAGRAYPKIYAADHGLITAFSAVSDPLSEPVVLGRVLEALVFHQLRHLVRNREISLSYLRDRAGKNEVDFVIHEGVHIRTFIEVTASRNPRDKVEPLRGQLLTHKGARAVVVHNGIEHDEEGGLRVVPMEKFLLDPGQVLEGQQ